MMMLQAAKRETFCLAQAVQAPKWGTPKDQTRSKNELELAMKNVFDWNVGQMIAVQPPSQVLAWPQGPGLLPPAPPLHL